MKRFENIETLRDRLARQEADAIERRRVLYNLVYYYLYGDDVRASLAERRTDANR